MQRTGAQPRQEIWRGCSLGRISGGDAHFQSACRLGRVTQARREMREGEAPVRSSASTMSLTVLESSWTRSVLGRHSMTLSSSTYSPHSVAEQPTPDMAAEQVTLLEI